MKRECGVAYVALVCGGSWWVTACRHNDDDSGGGWVPDVCSGPSQVIDLLQPPGWPYEYDGTDGGGSGYFPPLSGEVPPLQEAVSVTRTGEFLYCQVAQYFVEYAGYAMLVYRGESPTASLTTWSMRVNGDEFGAVGADNIVGADWIVELGGCVRYVGFPLQVPNLGLEASTAPFSESWDVTIDVSVYEWVDVDPSDDVDHEQLGDSEVITWTGAAVARADETFCGEQP